MAFLLSFVATVIGFTAGRCFSPFLINRFTYPLLRHSRVYSDTSEGLGVFVHVQRIASAGAGAGAAFLIWLFAYLFGYPVSIWLWGILSLLVAFVARCLGFTAPNACFSLAGGSFWLVYLALLYSVPHANV